MTFRLKNKFNLSQDFSLEARTMLAKIDSFPVEGVSEDQSATLSVNLDKSRESNDRLFGVNLGWHIDDYKGTRTFTGGYNGEEAQSLVRRWAPEEIRWGSGLWANFYDYETDKRSREGYPEDGKYFGGAGAGVSYGIDGFADLQKELGFDALFTWNINQDSPQDGVNRLADIRGKGIDVDRIELGNELFFPEQRGGRTRLSQDQRDDIKAEVEEEFKDFEGTAAQKRAAIRDETNTIIDRQEASRIAFQARQQYNALKNADPDLEVSVPVSFRVNGPGKSDKSIRYNKALSEKQDFYDAVSLHRYVRADEDNENEKTRLTDRDVLDARNIILGNAQEVRDVFKDKDIWLSEFAISSDDNEARGNDAISALSLADTYLGFIDNPDLIASAEYFQGNSGTPLINFERNDDGSFDHTRTTLGATYDGLREVFTDSKVLDSSVASTAIDGKIDSVSAEVAEKDGKVLVYAVNKSPFEADFDLEFDGKAFRGNYEFQTVEFDDAADSLNLDDDRARLTLENSVFGEAAQRRGSTVKLPGLSMSLISIDRALV